MNQENAPPKSAKPKSWAVGQNPQRKTVKRCRQSTDIGWDSIPVAKKPENNERWQMSNPVLYQRITRGKPFLVTVCQWLLHLQLTR